MEVMKALYPPEGGRPLGFVCMEAAEDYPWCGKVTRTQRGMWAHLRKKHKVKKQADFVFECDVPLVEAVLPSPEQAKRQAAQGNTF